MEASTTLSWAAAGKIAGGFVVRASQRGRFRLLLRVLGAAAVCAILVGFSVRFVDRPVADWVHLHLGDARFALITMAYGGHPLQIGPFSLMAGPAEAAGQVATLLLVILAVAAFAGRRLRPLERTALAVSLAIRAAIDINTEVKFVFGRTWPESWLGNNPSWIRDGVYGFSPFHGGAAWGSFPSGHTTVITVLATLLWRIWPEFRVVWAAMVAVVAVGLTGANYHFVSDVIGGVFLGMAIGLGSAALMSQVGGFRQPVLPTAAPSDAVIGRGPTESSSSP